MGTRLVGSARTRIGSNQRSTRRKLAVSVAVLAVVGAYVALIMIYSRGASPQPLRVLERPAGSNGTTVTLEVEDVQSNYTVLMANLTVLPGAELLDPVTHSLKEDLSVAVTSVARPTNLTWSKGMFRGVVPVPLTLAGDIENWPFDRC